MDASFPDADHDVPIGDASKRKSPFVKLITDGTSSENDNDSVSGGSAKHLRKYSFDVDLPSLLPNECEIVADIAELLTEINSCEFDESGQVRIERVSPICFSGRLKFRLVLFLTRRIDNPEYDLGLFIRSSPPDFCQKTDYWVYRPVSILVMFFNTVVSSSRVSQDVCPLSSNDSCRGWLSLVSFTTVEDLFEQNFLFGGTRLVVRGQACFDGCESVANEAATNMSGLENLGATCYLNGLLQSLFHLGKFREIVYRGKSGGNDILEALQFVFYQLEAGGGSVGSSALTRAFGWDTLDESVQHDAQELNRLLIDRIESRLKGGTEIRDLFVGQVENFIQCIDSDYCSTRVEFFYDLQLSILRLDGSHNASVEEAISQYLAPEILQGPNAYETPDGSKQRAKKGIKFVSLPPVLTLQLMRFQFDFDTCEMAKINAEFRFGSELDMSPFSCSDNDQYILYSVLVHSGSISSGHYYSFICNEKNEWTKFDDTLVSRVPSFCAIENNFGGSGELPTVNYLTDDSSEGSCEKTFSAYMLTYIRKDVASDLLAPRFLAATNPDLLLRMEQLGNESVRHKGRRRKSVHVRIVDLSIEDVFSTPVFSSADISPKWCVYDSLLPGDAPLPDCLSSTCLWFHNNQVSLLTESMRNACIELFKTNDLVLLTTRQEILNPLFVMLLNFNSNRLEFKGIVPVSEIDAVNHYVQEGLLLKRVDRLEPGSVIIAGEANDYFEATANTFPVDYIWYVWQTGKSTCESRIVDVREPHDLVDCQIFQFNPFTCDVAPPAVGASILDVMNKDTLAMHIVRMPPTLLVNKRPVLLRGACNVMCYLAATDPLSELFTQVGDESNVRILEVDNCKIVNEVPNSGNLVAAGLLCWGARNIFQSSNFLLLEPKRSAAKSFWCYHAKEEVFGTPFVLDYDEDEDLSDLVAQKLAIRGFKLSKEGRYLRITHTASNHSMQMRE